MVEGAIRKSPIAVKKKGIFLSDPSPIIALPCQCLVTLMLLMNFVQNVLWTGPG